LKILNNILHKKSTLNLRQREATFLEIMESESVKPGTIFYHAFRTCIMSCSPFALFQQLVDDPEYANFEHIWVYGSEAVLENDTFKRYVSHPRVRFVKQSSEDHVRALATSQYLVTNAGLPSYWQKCPGQIVVNTWHGTPLKALGKDAKDFDGFSIGNAQRNFLTCDYLVMPNRFTAERILDSYGVKDIFTGTVVDEGAPRTDLVLNSDHARTRSLLEEKLGRSLEGRKIIVYAPTFRSRRGKSLNTTEEMAQHMNELMDCAPEGYEVFFKVHNTLGAFFAGDEVMESRLLFDEIQTEELLGVTDVLMTDYSSIFFDFICTGRPVLFFVYDKEEYSANHGMYLDTADMPGTECFSMDEVAGCLKRIAAGVYCNPNMEQARERFAYNDDGGATRRVLDIVFGKGSTPVESSPDIEVGRGTHDAGVDAKKNVLISLNNTPSLSNMMALREILCSLDPAEHRVIIAACGVHLIWRMVDDVFPSARILFMRIADPTHGNSSEMPLGFHEGQFDKFFPGMHFDLYYNLKAGESFLDEMLERTHPDLEWHWHFCWSSNLKEDKLQEVLDHYKRTVVYCSPRDDLAEWLEDDRVELVHPADIRGRSHHRMTVLMIAAFDSMNYTLAACANELRKAGYEVVVASSKPKSLTNNRMFGEKGINVVSIRSVNAASLLFIDIAIGSPIVQASHRRVYASIARYNVLLMGFANLFSSVAMRFNPDILFTIGEEKAREFNRYNLRYNCVAIGDPQYDELCEARRDRSVGGVRSVLFLDQGGYPYGAEGKRQLAQTLVRVARDNPGIRFDVKPRYLPDEKGTLHTVADHLYDFIEEPPENLVLMEERCNLGDIVTNYDALMTMWSTAYLDALVLGMPMLLIEGFDSIDVFDVRAQRVAEAYDRLRETGCVRHYSELVGDISGMFRVADEAYAKDEVYRCGEPAARRVVRFMELAYETLVVPGLRIADDFALTEEEYYWRFGSFNLVDADSDSWLTRRRYRNRVNRRLQEYVYLNRCMGAVLDLAPFEQLYDVEVPALPNEAAREFCNVVSDEMSAEFIAVRGRYFDSVEGKEAIEHDRILQDFYFDYLYMAERYDELYEPRVETLLSPEGLEYNLARVELNRLRFRRAYDHLFEFLRLAQSREVNQLLRCKRMKTTLRRFRGKRLPIFLSYLFREENTDLIPYLYRDIARSSVLTLHEAQRLNAEGSYEECVVLCSRALRRYSAKGKKRKTVYGTMKLYGKKALYRAIKQERKRAQKALETL